MAALCVTAVRRAFKGVSLVPGRWPFTQTVLTPAGCQCLRPQAARCLQVSAASRTDTEKRTQSHSSDTGDRKAKKEEEEEEEEEEYVGPDYIPTKKAKNPMMKIGYAWMIGLPTGIIGFILAKRQVDKNRLKQLKIRQRMRRSNEGEYQGSRYRHHTEDVKLDR